jgi:hypothetical protein
LTRGDSEPIFDLGDGEVQGFPALDIVLFLLLVFGGHVEPSPDIEMDDFESLMHNQQ